MEQENSQNARCEQEPADASVADEAKPDEESNPYIDEIKALNAKIDEMQKKHEEEITKLIKSINGTPKDTRTAEQKMADEVVERINKNRR